MVGLMKRENSMRSLVKAGIDKRESSVTDHAVPQVRPGEVLLRVEACGLCGSDIHAWRSDPGYEWVEPPVVLGHEFVGTIVEKAPDVTHWSVGDRAVVVSIQGCLTCDECLAGRTQRCPARRVIGLSYDGGMSQYVRVSAEYLVRVPADMKAEIAAAVEPLSVAAHGVLSVGGVHSGQKVVVSGAGFVGIGCALIARDAGAEVVLVGAPRDADTRLAAASALGIRTLTTDQGGWGEPDVWVEASGASAALASAFEHTRTGGRIAVVGMFTQPPTTNFNLLVRRELEVRGSYASVLKDYSLVIDLLTQGRLEVESLLEKFDLEQGVSALESAAESKILKPILIPAQ
jgi:L-iditol 2-dehydrogenase